VSQPVAGVMLVVPVVVSQLIVALVSPDPPSRKLTWMSESGGFVKATTPVPVGRLVVQLVPWVATTTMSVWLASPYPGGGVVSLTV
jgi:hypothetical protein